MTLLRTPSNLTRPNDFREIKSFTDLKMEKKSVGLFRLGFSKDKSLYWKELSSRMSVGLTRTTNFMSTGGLSFEKGSAGSVCHCVQSRG